ncbi:MAG: Coenzyme F420 hydrogenase/dehydrogenase, beta subunit C-terminal domain [Bacteroidales bacterium]|nr:Coenzyme F420 hydrogenase/dehydrogenase, beta subunit C-terminal domain [Bacteroidales bacterium]
MKKAKNIQDVVRSGLCNRCGTCVGLSGGKISFSDRTKKFVPVVSRELDEAENRKLLQFCSGNAFNFPEQNERIYGKESHHNIFTGTYRNIYIGNCTDEEIRRNGASGGILSAVLTWLLEKGKIDGAVVVGMSEEEPWLTRPFIATTKEEILQAAQSKYIITSTNELLPEIERFKGKLAFVGLPGQVQSIRLLQEQGHSSVKNIEYILGPFYGNTLHFSSVKSFLRSYGEKDYRKIRKLYFRYGEWPGNMRVELENGRVLELPKFHANYLIPFHIVKNSLLCTDLSNEFTDISGGDAWAPVYEERGKGFSMVLARSQKGQDIINAMQKEGLLSLDLIDENKAITMHSHGYDLKKRGTFIRMKYRKWLGRKNPDYGYEMKGFALKRYIMEVVIDALFLVLGTRFSRFLIERIPPKTVGRVFERSRNIWKRSTKKIKRSHIDPGDE